MRSIILLALGTAAMCDPIVYMIRHGEKPEDDGIGLSDEGLQRAECIRGVFGAGSAYNIGYIMAQEYKSNGKRKRPYDTVLPLASDLGLTVDVSCDRDDNKCVADAVQDYEGDGNILISWQHGQMNNIAEEIGAEDVKNYLEDRFDLIWTLPSPYDEVTDQSSENCPGLD